MGSDWLTAGSESSSSSPSHLLLTGLTTGAAGAGAGGPSWSSVRVVVVSYVVETRKKRVPQSPDMLVVDDLCAIQVVALFESK